MRDSPSALTFGPTDGDHHHQRVLVFSVRLVDSSQNLKRPGDFLHPRQHQSERHEGRQAVHQVLRAVEHEVPVGTRGRIRGGSPAEGDGRVVITHGAARGH